LANLFQSGENEFILATIAEIAIKLAIVVSYQTALRFYLVMLLILIIDFGECSVKLFAVIEIKFFKVNQTKEENSCASDGMPDYDWHLKFNHEVCQELGASHYLSASVRQKRWVLLNLVRYRRYAFVIALGLHHLLRNHLMLGQSSLGVR